MERRHFDPDDPALQRALKEPEGPSPAPPLERDRTGWLDWLDLPSFSDADGGGCLVGLLLGAVAGLGAVLLAAIGSAPALIAEVFVDAVLTGLLYRRLKHAARENWLGTAIRKTWGLVLATALLLALAGFCLDRLAPESNSVGKAVRELFR